MLINIKILVNVFFTITILDFEKKFPQPIAFLYALVEWSRGPGFETRESQTL